MQLNELKKSPDFVTFARLSKGTIEYQGISNICG